jgi:hypothetical protein
VKTRYNEAESENKDEGYDVVDDELQDDAADDEDVVAAWLSGALLCGNAEDDDSDDDDQIQTREEDISRRAENDDTSDSDEPGEDPPEQIPTCKPLLPEENEKNTHRRTRSTFSTSERTKFPLSHGPCEHNKHQYRDYGISFPEL